MPAFMICSDPCLSALCSWRGSHYITPLEILKQVPEKVLYQAPGMDESCACNRCPYMRLNTLEKLYRCLRDAAPRVSVPEELAKQARLPIERMLELT